MNNKKTPRQPVNSKLSVISPYLPIQNPSSVAKASVTTKCHSVRTGVTPNQKSEPMKLRRSSRLTNPPKEGFQVSSGLQQQALKNEGSKGAQATDSTPKINQKYSKDSSACGLASLQTLKSQLSCMKMNQINSSQKSNKQDASKNDKVPQFLNKPTPHQNVGQRQKKGKSPMPKYGFEGMASIDQIDFNEFKNIKKTTNISKKKGNQTSEKNFVIPPYTIDGMNSNSMLKMNPYQKFEDKGIFCSGFENQKKSSIKMSDDPKKQQIVNKYINAAKTQGSSAAAGKSHGKSSVKSGIIKKPTMSVSFYENHQHLAQATVQPFEDMDESNMSVKEKSKRKIMRLLGNQKKRDTMDHLQAQSEKRVILDQSDQKLQDQKCESQSKEMIVDQDMGPPINTGCQTKKYGKHSVKINKSKYFDKTPTNDDCNHTPNRVTQINQNMNQSGSSKIDNGDKCPSTISSYVGGFLNNMDKSETAEREKEKLQKNIEEMNQNYQVLQPDQVQAITGFAQQNKAIKQLTKNGCLNQDSQVAQDSKATQQIDQTANNKSPQPLQVLTNFKFGQIDAEKLAYLKTFPKIKLQQMGFGDLDYEKEEDFLSESSFAESDFNLLMQDDFFDIMKDVQDDLSGIQKEEQLEDIEIESEDDVIEQKNFEMPEYDPNLQYDSEFYNLFIQNQNLLEKIEQVADKRNYMINKIYRIQEYYDKNVGQMKALRYGPGQRKIHNRKTVAQLERNHACPYEGCEKPYASEGALNLHIKNKHNGGNKTDREKLAKNLIICKAQGLKVPDRFEINLPPGIVRERAEIIKQYSHIELNFADLENLEQKLQVQNRISEQQMKKEQLKKAEQEAQKAKQMVADKQCTPPKKMAKLHQKFNQINKNKTLADTVKAQASEYIDIVEDSEFLQPAPLKAQKRSFGDEITNTARVNSMEEPSEEPSLQKQMTFGAKNQENSDASLLGKKRSKKQMRKDQENNAPLNSNM